jgi:predicted PurR-regulated permease PerM
MTTEQLEIRPHHERQRPAQAGQPWSRPLWIIAGCALIVILRLGRDAFVPLALAVLLAFVFSGLVETLRGWHIPRAISAAVLLLLVALAIGGTLDAVATPAQQWLQSAPRVLRTIEQRIRPAQSLLRRLDYISRRASALASPEGESTGTLAVTAQAPASITPLGIFAATGLFALSAITVAAFAFLMLAAGPSTLARMSSLLGRDVHAIRALQIIDAIRREVGRYYGTLALLNLAFGTVAGVVMWQLGMPNPVLWGVVAGVLHFIPYLGPAVTAAILTLVALVTFNSNAHVLLVTAVYVGMAAIEGNIVEPWLLGRRLNLNPILVLLALWLGGWLWGVAGMVLALPMLLALKVATRRGTRPVTQTRAAASAADESALDHVVAGRADVRREHEAARVEHGAGVGEHSGTAAHH